LRASELSWGDVFSTKVFRGLLGEAGGRAYWDGVLGEVIDQADVWADFILSDWEVLVVVTELGVVGEDGLEVLDGFWVSDLGELDGIETVVGWESVETSLGLESAGGDDWDSLEESVFPLTEGEDKTVEFLEIDDAEGADIEEGVLREVGLGEFGVVEVEGFDTGNFCLSTGTVNH